MEDNQDVAEDESYSDDPVANPKIDWYYKLRSFAPVAILMLVTTIYLPSTVGSRISLNSGSDRVEFGQNVASLEACTESLGAKPLSSFVNASYSGNHKISGITISEIPSICSGVDLTISAYDTSTQTPLDLFGSGLSTLRIFNDQRVYKRCEFGYNLTSPDSSTFTISPATQTLNSNLLDKITVSTGKHTCTHIEYKLGDTGPGGGTVIYINTSGFACGPTWTMTGSPSNRPCYFLEVAPVTWNGDVADPQIPWCPSGNNDCPVPTIPNESGPSLIDIGRGYSYTKIVADYILANFGNGTGSSTYVVRSYSGGGLSDWYQPNRAEFNLVAHYAKNGPLSNPSTSAFSGTVNYSSCISPFLVLTYCVTSPRNQGIPYGLVNQFNSSRAWYFSPASGELASGAGKGSPGWRIRPIRAF